MCIIFALFQVVIHFSIQNTYRVILSQFLSILCEIWQNNTLIVYFQTFQVGFLVIGNAITLACLLYTLVVYPRRQNSLLNVRQDGLILLDERKTDVPGDCHIDVVLVRANAYYFFKLFERKIVVEKIAHCGDYAKAHRVGFV